MLEAFRLTWRSAAKRRALETGVSASTATAAAVEQARPVPVTPSGLHWAVVCFGGGLVLLVVAALPMVGALRLVFGLGVLWILSAAFLMLLGIAQVLRYSLRLQQPYELSATNPVVQDRSAEVHLDGVHFDLALKQFLLAARHQRTLGCIAVEIGEDSLRRLAVEAGWDAAASGAEASALGVAAMVTAEATRRSDLTIKGSGPRRLVVLCPETGRAGAFRVAEKVDRALRRDLGLEVRVGVSAFPGDASSLTKLLQRAELALRYPDSSSDPRQLAIEFPEWDVNGNRYVEPLRRGGR